VVEPGDANSGELCDTYPATGINNTLTACISIPGIGMFALPAGILAPGFEEFKKKELAEYCPHWGQHLGFDHIKILK